MGDAPKGTGLWERGDVLEASQGLAEGRGVASFAPRAALDELGIAGLIDWSRASLDSASVSAKRGEQGPVPIL
jgi:hypothetical protein